MESSSIDLKLLKYIHSPLENNVRPHPLLSDIMIYLGKHSLLAPAMVTVRVPRTVGWQQCCCRGDVAAMLEQQWVLPLTWQQ
jgi:hypothetical protein